MKNKIILGIGDFIHDNGIAIVKDYKLKYAVNEERISRTKFDSRCHRSLNSVDLHSEIKLKDIDEIALGGVSFQDYLSKHLNFSFKYALRTGKPLSLLYNAVKIGYKYSFVKNLSSLLKKLNLNNKKKTYVDHHECHASAAYYTSGHKKATIVTADGFGDGLSTAIFIGENGKIKRLSATYAPDSPGIFYSGCTSLLGFKPMRHEGKITGLAAFGKKDTAAYNLVKPLLKLNKNYLNLDMSYFTYRGIFDESIKDLSYLGKGIKFSLMNKLSSGLDMGTQLLSKAKINHTNKLNNLLKGFKREEIAYAFQRRLEEIMRDYVKYAVSLTGIKDVVVAGGIFANVRVNQRVRELDCVDSIYIYPHMGDGGTAAGAAFSCLAKDEPFMPYNLTNVYLGPVYSEEIILEALNKNKDKVKWEKIKDIEKYIAEKLSENKVIGNYNGRMEYGPRALGNRSILYTPTDVTVNDWLNKRMNRTEFMPFAPSTLEEYAKKCYEGYKTGDHASKFMTITFNCTDYMAKNCPAVVHVDNTARPQVVSKEDNPRYYNILKHYMKFTGLPTFINTSFNMHEEPIVNTPYDAIKAFLDGSVDILILEDYTVTLRK